MQSETRVEAYKLLEQIVTRLDEDLIQRWRLCEGTEDRESVWHSQRQLELIAGAIEDGIKNSTGE